MRRANDKPGARANEQTEPDTNEQLTKNYTRDRQPGQLHHALSLLVDSAIALDDATNETDVLGFDMAARSLNHNVGIVQALMIAWRSRYA